MMLKNPAMRPRRTTTARERFEVLYADHHQLVFGYVLRRSASPMDAADAIAETFMVVWRRLDDAPADERLAPWLYAIARRVLANHRRGERRRRALGELLQAELAARPLPLAAAFEEAIGERARLHDALATLSDEDRELLMLDAWEELDSGQIGTALGCSAGAARTRLHRARARLRAALSAENVPPQEVSSDV